MGNLSSVNQSSQLSNGACNMLKVQAGGNYSEHQTVKFSRNDLVDTVSELDLNSVFELHGGSKQIKLRNIPQRDRYTEFMTTKTMNIMNGGANVGGTFSSASEGDLSLIKSMIMGRQTGGASAESTNCGCETENVLSGGKLDLGRILASQIGGISGLSPESTYNPLHSMDSLSDMMGGNLSDYSSTNSNIMSTTSSFSDNMNGGKQNGGNSSRLSALSATSDFNQSQMGGNYSGLSATSDFNQSQMGGNYSALSATSNFNQSQNGLSATSPFNQSQNGGNLSRLSALSATSDFNQSQNGLSATSPFNQSQNGGNLSRLSALSATSPFNQSQMGGNFSATSTTSSLPIQYDSLIGGKNKNNKDNKDKKDKKKRVKASDSSSTSESTASSNLLMMKDMDASSSSTKSESDNESSATIARALNPDAMSEKTRALHRFSSDEKPKKDKKDKSKKSDSSNTSDTSSTTMTKSSSTSTSASSSTTPGEAIAKVNSVKYGNLLLTSPNSASISDSLVNAKQFYSSENGDLFSSESNFLKNNIRKNRLR